MTISSGGPAPAVLAFHQLRKAPGDFVGRKDDLAALLAAGDGVAAITGLRGLGGIGKTALALKAAEQLKERYPDAQLEISLRGSRSDPLSAVEAMLQVIRAWHPEAPLPDDAKAIGEAYRSVLEGKRVLLLLDDARDEAQVEPLLPPGSCYVLITSRRHLVLPGLRALDLGTLPEPDACALLRAITPRIGDRAGELAALCGCLPLALRVAASYLAKHPTLGVGEYIERLRQARGRLEEVEASLSLSYELLPAGLRRRWTMLSVFSADFEVAGATAVFGCGEEEAQESLDELVGYSLVQLDERKRRLRLHDLVRVYADARLELEERTKVQARHAEHFLSVLKAADKLYLEGGKNVIRGLALVDREWPNIVTGQAWAARSEDKAATRLCAGYPEAGAYVLDLRLHPEEKIRWLEGATAASRKLGDRRVEGYHLGNLGNAYADLGQPKKAIEYHEQALAILREIGDRRGEGNALGSLGIAYRVLGQTKKAIEYYEQSLAIDREIGDRRGEDQDLGNLGNAYADLGQPKKAIEYYEQALAIDREIGDRRGEGQDLGNLGNAYADLGQPKKAVEYLEQALVIDREIGDRRGEGGDLGNLGNAYAYLGQPKKAIEYHEQALAIHREIGNRGGEGAALGNLGNVYHALGLPKKAIEYHEQALAISREIGDRRGEGQDLGNLGNAYADLGQPKKAVEYYEKRLVIAREIGDRMGDAIVCWNMGGELAKTGDFPRAVELMKVRVNFEREIGHPDAEKHGELVRKLQDRIDSKPTRSKKRKRRG